MAKSKSKLKPKTKSKAPAKVQSKAKSKVKSSGPAKAVKASAKVAAPKKVAQAKPKAFAPSKAKAVVSADVTRFTPLDDRILVQRVSGEERTPGGLYIPDSAQEKPNRGRVVAVGRGHRDAKGRTRPCDVKVGDDVLFTAWSGAEIEFDGSKYMIIRETDLLGVANS